MVSKVKGDELVNCENFVRLYSFCNYAFLWKGLLRRSLAGLAMGEAYINIMVVDYRMHISRANVRRINWP